MFTIYPDSPHFHPVSDSQYELDRSYFCAAFCGGSLLIRAGYRTDGGSIPRLFWRFIGNPMQGVLCPAFLVHDALYSSECLTRAAADSVLLSLCRDLSAFAFHSSPFPTRLWRIHIKPFLIWFGVRLGGWAVWASHTRHSDPLVSFRPFPYE